MRFGLYAELQTPPEKPHAELMTEVMRQMEHADQVGFDVYSIIEHHFFQEFSISANPLALICAVAQKTRRPTRDGRKSPLSTKRWTVRSHTLRISDTSARVSSSKPLRWCALVMTGPWLFSWFVWRRSGAVPGSCATGRQNIFCRRARPAPCG